MPMPPMPPGTAQQSPAPPTPNFMQMAGQQTGQAAGGMAPMTPGMSQISEAAVRMGAEIDQALKLLAQSIPNLAPWVEKTCMELRYQLGTALNSQSVPTNPTPQDSERFPDGGGRI